jgi:hypothetical protein
MCVSTKATTSWTLCFSTRCWFLYQIRTKRVGRQRLVTRQAWIENRIVPLVWKTALAVCEVVIFVFNFFLIGFGKTSVKRHSVFVLVFYAAKLNDKELEMITFRPKIFKKLFLTMVSEVSGCQSEPVEDSV